MKITETDLNKRIKKLRAGMNKIPGDARIKGNAEISGHVLGDAWLYYCDARVLGDADISGNAQVFGKKE